MYVPCQPGTKVAVFCQRNGLTAPNFQQRCAWLSKCEIHNPPPFCRLVLPLRVDSHICSTSILNYLYTEAFSRKDVYHVHTCSYTVHLQNAVINPRRACAARVTAVVLCVCMYMYVCMYVCVYVCVCVHSYLPPHTLESQKRDINRFCAIQGSF